MSSVSAAASGPETTAPRPKLRPPVGKRMRWLLNAVLGLCALLIVNSTYIGAITLQGWLTGQRLENQLYLWMFLGHLVLGLALLAPFIVFGCLHWARGRFHPNKRAIAMGWVLLVSSAAVLATGILLMRLDIGGITLAVRQTQFRSLFYWLHVLVPLVVAWAFILHRLAGRKIRWRTGAGWAVASVALTLGFSAWHRFDASRPRPQPKDGAAYFEPSLARTANGALIPERSLMMNEYCMECHPDAYRTHAQSVHSASSFNNPAYAFSVRETRKQAFDREQTVQDARFCAGCHDPVPFFSGAFQDSRFDDPNYDVANDPLGSASLTCTACHSIVSIGSTRGNADFVIEESPQYPFTFSSDPFLRWVNRQLIKAKPSFHARTFMKPDVHRAPDGQFCSTCHKVFLPEELNDYHWLPGQNHYDSFRLSAVSGHGIQAWRFPAKVEADCNGCHMPTFASADDLGAKPRGDHGEFTIRDHTFVSANTAAQALSGLPGAADAAARVLEFNRTTMRTDIVAVRPGKALDGNAVAPLRPQVPTLVAGLTYVLDIATRTVKIGHEFTQGTADSNEVWLEVTATSGGALPGAGGAAGGGGPSVIGRSGARDASGGVDPWAKFLNIFMLDRNGYRIDRRNPQDIFAPLYNHQIPPGGADTTHFVLKVPETGASSVTVRVALQYRKFDLTYMRKVKGDSYVNDLPVVTFAADEVTFAVAPAVSVDGAAFAGETPAEAPKVPASERLYDWGIGLFREAERGQGKGAWTEVDRVLALAADAGEPKAWVARARAALQDGRIPDAGAHLRKAAEAGAPPWMVAYWSAVVDMQQGEYDRAIAGFRAVSTTAFPAAHAAGFDFSRDDRILVDLATALFERSRQFRGTDEATAERRQQLLTEADAACRRALELDVQRAATWYVLSQVAEARGDAAMAAEALKQYERYRPDDNARDYAVNTARLRYPAANHAAEGVVFYDLAR